MENQLSETDKIRRKSLSSQARKTAIKTLTAEGEDDDSIMVGYYEEFYLQIAFSPLHPLMVFHLARCIDRNFNQKDRRLINHLNHNSVLGCHALDEDAGCYCYRAAHWLEIEITEKRLIEILDRLIEEAMRGYNQLKS